MRHGQDLFAYITILGGTRQAPCQSYDGHRPLFFHSAEKYSRKQIHMEVEFRGNHTNV
jgi:hypothetical protein